MTRRLYYTDAMRRAFEAQVVGCVEQDGRVAMVLDETAFYPTSGGQPFDTGSLGGQRVIDVVDRDDGTIAHVVGEAIPIGTRVAGEIDWPRRFDHMQQHTGQHILSAAFDRRCGARTVSFHLGADTSTIDVARAVSAAEIADALGEANHVVWDDRVVSVRFSDASDAAALPLRKESARTGELRLVEIPDCDLSACGGTHVPRTGMVGAIVVTATERFKGGSRVTFACGARAVRAHGELRDVAAAAARMLSVPAAEIPAAIERLQLEIRTAGKALEQLEGEAGLWRAGALRADAETVGGLRVVLTVQQDRDAAALKRLGAAIVTEPCHVAVLVGGGTPAPVVIARSQDVAFDAGRWMKRAAEALGGRGGGRPEQAQGGLAASPDAILAFAKATIGRQEDE